MSVTTRFLVAMFFGAMLVVLLSACGGGSEPLPNSQAGVADTGVPIPTPRVDCALRPELCT
jgi:hypothetical protein